ncbi:hypothetical protein OOZ19_14785 [Saccharopolyspora sp. NFXS83]|uniref:hypothetical protein n=1 Tax=Saccharopolyspora sp. NFXS83 TaxID=2993560 RepID=UPI00224B4785|nr:hypothetical protein [Saccharopolyspora sp. NFXS83]MCX2731509.1 hypothetical protein [Saccharopolyspora sp. NFXS83]
MSLIDDLRRGEVDRSEAAASQARRYGVDEADAAHLIDTAAVLAAPRDQITPMALTENYGRSRERAEERVADAAVNCSRGHGDRRHAVHGPGAAPDPGRSARNPARCWSGSTSTTPRTCPSAATARCG